MYFYSSLFKLLRYSTSLGITLKTMGYILILLGAALLYFRRRNKFNRRNVAGVEEFKSFEHSVGNRVLEMGMKIVAYLLIRNIK